MTEPNASGPGRTFEDFEQRQRELHAAELDAVRTLVLVLRELSIALPPESRFPYVLADAAKRLTEEGVARYERWGGSPQLAAGLALHDLTGEIAQEMRRWSPPEDES